MLLALNSPLNYAKSFFLSFSWLPNVSERPFSSFLLRGHTARDHQVTIKSDSQSEGIQICFLLSSRDGWVSPQPAVHHFYGQQGTCHLSIVCMEHLPGPFQAEESPGVAVHFCNIPHLWAKLTAPHLLGFLSTSSVVNLVPQSLEFKNWLIRVTFWYQAHCSPSNAAFTSLSKLFSLWLTVNNCPQLSVYPPIKVRIAD